MGISKVVVLDEGLRFVRKQAEDEDTRIEDNVQVLDEEHTEGETGEKEEVLKSKTEQSEGEAEDNGNDACCKFQCMLQ